MNEIVTSCLYLLSGICVYAAFSHMFTGLQRPRNATHVVFSGMCLMAAAFSISHAVGFRVTGIDTYAAILQWNIAFAILFFILLLWFVALYTGEKPRLPLLVLGGLLVLLFAANLMRPYSLQYSHISELRLARMPWGETLSHALGRHDGLTYFAAIVAGACLVYVLYAMLGLCRRERSAWGMLLAVMLFLLSMSQGILVRISAIDSFEFGIFGYVGMVILMSALLSRHARRQLSSSESRFRALVEQSPFSIQILAPDGRTMLVNAAWEKLWGIRKEDIAGHNILEDRRLELAGAKPYIERGLAGTAVEIPPIAYTLAGDSVESGAILDRWVRAYIYPIKDEGGKIREAILMHEDVTEQRRVGEALRQSEERLRFMLETSPIAVRIAASAGRKVLFANQSYARLINIDRNQVIGADPKCYYIDPEDYEEVMRLISQGENISNRLVELCIPGIGAKWVLASYLPIHYEGAAAVLGWFYDITELKRAEAQLTLSARVFSEAQEGIMITDANGTIVEVNPTFSDITGYGRAEVVGQNPRLLKSDKHAPEFYDAMWSSLVERGYWHGEVWNRRKNGELYAELLTISALRDEQGKPMHYVGLCTDITHAKHQQQALELMAHYDVLTKLPNRILFADRFSQAIARSKREGTLLAMCYLDLDGFKRVNDTHGHQTGDQLLVEVGERVKSILREGDTISRFGGDEFAILLGDLHTMEQCEQVLGRILQTIAQPYHLNEQSFNIAASAGYTLYPLDDADVDTLLRHADQAMYQAKLQGRNRCHMFDAAQDQQAQSRRQKLGMIEEAFLRHEFCLYYQPKIDMKRGAIIGAEALIRWRHPQQGIIPPAEFLPVVVGTPLEISMGQWVIEEALRQLESWQQAGIELQVSVNISPCHLQDREFFAHLDAALSRHPDVPSRKLQLEVVESSVLDDLNAVTEVIRACRDALGVSIALDDFGTGYSSLTYLRHLPVNTIKIDQTFVRNMIDAPHDHAIVEGVISLAEAFRHDVIAEGVETRDHGLMLLAQGCTQAQGYGIACPMPADALEAWVRGYRPDAQWLDYARHPRSPSQTMVMQLLIENRHWVGRIAQCVNTSHGAVPRWPIMEHEKCHSGRWVYHARKQNLFDALLLDNIDTTHRELHGIGNLLMQMWRDGNLQEARAGIASLNEKHKTIESMLRQLA